MPYKITNNILHFQVSNSNAKRQSNPGNGTPDSYYYLMPNEKWDVFNGPLKNLVKENVEYDFVLEPNIIENSFSGMNDSQKSIALNWMHSKWDGKMNAKVIFLKRNTGQFSIHIGDLKSRNQLDKNLIEHLILNSESIISFDFNKMEIEIKNNSSITNIDDAFKADIPWLATNKFGNISKDILFFIHTKFPNTYIRNEEFPMMLSKASGKDIELINYIYSFRDNSDKYIDHLIRNTRNTLVKSGMLISTNGRQPFRASEKMIGTVDNYSENVIKFIDFMERSSGFEANQITLDDLNEIKKYEDKFIPKEKVERLAAIVKLRKKFRESLKEQAINILKLNELDSSSFIEGNNFKYPEAAHIMPVYYLFKIEDFDSIKDPNNGIYLDPNTHTLLDRGDLIFDDNYNLVSSDGKTIELSKKILTPERKAYIDMYKKKIQ